MLPERSGCVAFSDYFSVPSRSRSPGGCPRDDGGGRGEGWSCPHTHHNGDPPGSGRRSVFLADGIICPTLLDNSPPSRLATAEQHTTITAVPSSHRGGALYHIRGQRTTASRAVWKIYFFLLWGDGGGGGAKQISPYSRLLLSCALFCCRSDYYRLNCNKKKFVQSRCFERANQDD